MRKKIYTIIIIALILFIGNAILTEVISDKYNVNYEVKNSIKKDMKSYIDINHIPRALKDGVVYTEDRRFYSHGGFDLRAIARATVANVKAKKVVQGGSTITQQLAKNLYLTFDQTIYRKFEEVFIAQKLEKVFTKDEILEMYLNVIYYGEGAYGVQEASMKYFNKNVWELNDGECKALVKIPQAPSVNNPIKNPQGFRDIIVYGQN